MIIYMFEQIAPWKNIRQWFLISLIIALLMLFGVVFSATLLPASPTDGSTSLLLGPYSQGQQISNLDNFLEVLRRNLIVLLLHFFCCLVGAIIGREHKPLNGRWQRFSGLHQELPKWVADLSLAYALTATLASVAIQTTGLGFILASISAYSGLSPWELGLLILPHAPLELTAVFLPLGLFLIQARKKDLRPLNSWAWQSFLIALPLIVIAALIEVLITPQLISEAITSNGGLPYPEFGPGFN